MLKIRYIVFYDELQVDELKTRIIFIIIIIIIIINNNKKQNDINIIFAFFCIYHHFGGKKRKRFFTLVNLMVISSCNDMHVAVVFIFTLAVVLVAVIFLYIYINICLLCNNLYIYVLGHCLIYSDSIFILINYLQNRWLLFCLFDLFVCIVVVVIFFIASLFSFHVNILYNSFNTQQWFILIEIHLLCSIRTHSFIVVSLFFVVLYIFNISNLTEWSSNFSLSSHLFYD